MSCLCFSFQFWEHYVSFERLYTFILNCAIQSKGEMRLQTVISQRMYPFYLNLSLSVTVCCISKPVMVGNIPEVFFGDLSIKSNLSDCVVVSTSFTGCRVARVNLYEIAQCHCITEVWFL